MWSLHAPLNVLETTHLALDWKMVDICDWSKNSLQSVFGYIGHDSGMRDELRHGVPETQKFRDEENRALTSQCLITKYVPE
ncbi:hypothetical protein [Marinobacterium stanieri]|uniref:hypothetical protein n=1 Tax=Marinobacterium stanieri TaxID=49186 RepID=UPI00111192CE|nr:hypothetical protein [Marinobacterium stanieri]